jgi:hypothetical protein
MEINEIRPFFVRAMGVLTQLTRNPAADSKNSAFDFKTLTAFMITIIETVNKVTRSSSRTTI